MNNFELGDIRSVSNFEMWSVALYNIYDIVKELGKKEYLVNIGSIVKSCLCVASGEFTCSIFPGTEHKNCDIAAVKVIVEEAGGTVTDLFGNEQRYDESINGAVISNGKVHNEVTETVKKYLKDRK